MLCTVIIYYKKTFFKHNKKFVSAKPKINILFILKILDKQKKMVYNELSQKNIEVNNPIKRKEI